MKTEKQLKALRQAQNIYYEATINALNTDNFWRLNNYSRLLYKAENLKPIPLSSKYWVLEVNRY